MFAAAMVANLLNVAGKTLKRTVTAKQLLGMEEAPVNVMEMDPEERARAIERAIEKAKARRNGQQATSAKKQVRRKG